MSLVGEEQWALKLPELQPLERVHLISEAVGFEQETL